MKEKHSMKPHDDIRPTAAHRWIEKAQRHYATAMLNHHHGGYRDTTCYFAHQTVEIGLKGFLVAKDIRFPRVHVLPQLLTLCVRADDDFRQFGDGCVALNRYYIEEKYPLDTPVDHTEQDVEEALKISGEILDFIKKKLSP